MKQKQIMWKQTGTIVASALLFLTGGCAKKKETKPSPESSFDQLKGQIVFAQEKKKLTLLTQHLEQMIREHSEHSDIPLFKLQLAETYLQAGNLASAYTMFKHFSKMYPAHEKAEYANYKAIVAQFYQTLKINRDCDTTETEKTIALCKEYLDNEKLQAYVPDIRDIHETCFARLVDKEVYIFNHYIRHAKYQSAEKRLVKIKEHYLSKDQSLEPRILFLECKLAQCTKNDSLASDDLRLLSEKYPTSQFTRMAENLNNKSFFTL